MKLTAVAQAISVASARLGMSLSAQAESTVAAVQVQSIHLAYEIGQWIIRFNKLDPINVIDGAGIVSEMFISFFKTKTDSAALAEAIALEFHKNLRDNAGLTDVQIFEFFKNLSDQAAASDHYSASMAKPVADQYSVMEESVIAFYKALTESAGFTDDQVIEFGKVLTDTAGASEQVSWDVAKPLADAVGVLESSAKALAKTIYDQITVTDDFDGVASVNDDQTMLFNKGVTDVAGFTDLISMVVNYARASDDTVAAADHLSFDLAKPLSDVPIIGEQISKGLSKAPITDQFVVTDQPSLGTGLVKQDSTTITDSGSLRSQGYCEFSYFAEDYVGASQTF